MTRSKDIGTAAETAVVKFLKLNGFPQAERRALAGTLDKGDLINTGDICFEVKAGKVAETAAPAFLAEAQRQTLAEQVNSGAAWHCLVTKRRGVGAANAGQWWAYMLADQLAWLYAQSSTSIPGVWVRLTLEDAVAIFDCGLYRRAVAA